jgi:preprotein translocase subunit SecA
MLTRQIERAQRKVEAYNFDLRKNLLEYDDVANDQRKVVYAQRNELMASEDVQDTIRGMREEVIGGLVDESMPPESVEEQWKVAQLEEAILREFNVQANLKAWLEEDDTRGPKEALARLVELVERAYAEKEALVGSADLRRIERTLMLQMVDQQWREHLAAMDYMRQGIFLRSYAQKNPKQEYKREAFELFQAMLGRIRTDTVTLLSRMQIRSEAEIEREERERAERMARMMQFQHAAPPPVSADVDPEAAAAGPMNLPPADEPRRQAAPPQNVAPFERPMPKVGRNEPCPCGSGKKFKHCHGQLQQEA